MRVPKNGDQVTFVDGGNVYDGICNGEPYTPEGSETPTHVPVYVQDTDKCVVVALTNLVEMPVIP